MELGSYSNREKISTQFTTPYQHSQAPANSKGWDTTGPIDYSDVDRPSDLFESTSASTSAQTTFTTPSAAAAFPLPVHPPSRLPKVTITYCTQCRWLLRAAYYAQELLSTFEGSLGEVALAPSTGGKFTVEVDCPASTGAHDHNAAAGRDGGQDLDCPDCMAGVDDGSMGSSERSIGMVTSSSPTRRLIWDRKAEGGFPETKVLKQRVRDLVQPAKDLGHSDIGGRKKQDQEQREVAA